MHLDIAYLTSNCSCPTWIQTHGYVTSKSPNWHSFIQTTDPPTIHLASNLPSFWPRRPCFSVISDLTCGSNSEIAISLRPFWCSTVSKSLFNRFEGFIFTRSLHRSDIYLIKKDKENLEENNPYSILEVNAQSSSQIFTPEFLKLKHPNSPATEDLSLPSPAQLPWIEGFNLLGNSSSPNDVGSQQPSPLE